MPIKQYTKNIYNKFGLKYHEHRLNPNENFWNEFIEVPAMSSILRNLVENKKVLDLGCGSGLFTKKLKKWGANVIGLDLSETLIEIAKTENPDIRFYVGDASRTPFKNSEFDIICSSLMIHYFKNLTPLFRETNRILKKNGYFIFSVQHPVNEVIKKIKIKGIREFLLTPYFHNNANKWNCIEDVEIITYHHTFETIFKSLNKNNFVVEMLFEPKPKKDTEKINPRAYYRTGRVPSFAIFKTKKLS